LGRGKNAGRNGKGYRRSGGYRRKKKEEAERNRDRGILLDRSILP
jgi:hypothetical protein